MDKPQNQIFTCVGCLYQRFMFENIRVILPTNSINAYPLQLPLKSCRSHLINHIVYIRITPLVIYGLRGSEDTHTPTRKRFGQSNLYTLGLTNRNKCYVHTVRNYVK